MGKRAGSDAAASRDRAVGAEHESAVWMGPQTLEPRFQCVWQQPVIGVQKNQQLSLGRADTRIACGGKTLVRLLDTDHTGITGRDLGGGVGRAVVDDDDFMVLVGL